MQDEVTKHTKKIYDTIKNDKHSFGEKVKEVIIEIFIIVFAVTLSIWLHSWSEERHEKTIAAAFLKGLKKDLTEDIQQLTENKNLATALDSNFVFLYKIKSKTAIDTATEAMIGHRLYFSLNSTRPNIGRYEGFKSSGKIETIENDSLKQNILVFYQQIMPDVAFGEEYTNSLQLKMLDLDIDWSDKSSKKAFVTTPKIKSMLQIGAHNFSVNINHYNKAIAQAKKIIFEIDHDTAK